MHHHHHHHRHPWGGFRGTMRARHALPLQPGSWLDLETDLAAVELVPVAAGEEPDVELIGDEPLPELTLTVDESGGGRIVRLRGGVLGPDLEERFVRSRVWEGRFWERLRWRKHFHLQLIFHVPRDVRA